MYRLLARLLCLITVVALSIFVGRSPSVAAADLIVVLQSEGGGKESNPLSVIVPLLLVAVWGGMGILMFRKARARKRSAGPPD